MNSEQIIRETLINVDHGIRNFLDFHHIKHEAGTSDHDQIERIQSDLLSNLEKLSLASHEEFVEQLKSLVKGPQKNQDWSDSDQ